MGLADINRAEYVERAAAEFTRLGRWAFLSKYGFDASRKYLLKIGDSLFDSKAVLGVAHRFAAPREGALRPDQFSGGMATAVAKLRQLGFRTLSQVDSFFDAGVT
jgi:hypothetical protein